MGRWTMRTAMPHPTGMALTPVPNAFDGRCFLSFGACFFPPRCVLPSSSSPTVQVRFFVAAITAPEVFDRRCGSETVSSPCFPACTRFVLCSVRALFRSLTLVILVSLFPPPPAVSSTFIFRPSSSEWCSFSPCCNAFGWLNSRKAQPFDFDVAAFLGVSRRTCGGGSHTEKCCRITSFEVV